MTNKSGSVRLNLDEELRALTESPTTSRAGGVKRKFTFSLLFCCFTMGMASFQFGLAISSLNSVTQPVKTFTRNELILFKPIPVEQAENSTESTSGGDEATTEATTLFQKYKPLLKKVYIDVDEDGLVDLIFTITNCLFVLGGMLGSVTSKYVLDGLGRKKGTLFHNLFSVIGAALIILAYYFKSPFTAMFSRFFFGIQSGMSCTLVPTYMNEVSPSNLRGQTGIVHQLFINFGIILGQLLGFTQILGTDSLWHFLLALPLIPAILNFILLLLFFPETPRELFLTHRDVGNARKALQLLRNDFDVNDELQEIYKESSKSEDNEKISLGKLFTKSSLRWPLITSLVLQMSQQFCGVNAIFYYSSGIFERANIKPEYIQYAILGTGLVNALTTIIAIPLIDRVGRRLLLIIPIALIILDFIALTAFLKFQESFWYFPYLSIACILLFLCCFGFSLGPIPFLYTAEVFPQSARNTAMAVANLTNWFSGFILTLAFPFLLKLISQYVFLIFSGFLAFALTVIITKVPETNGKTPEQIAALFQKKK